MREVELKAVLDDWDARRRRIEAAGARLVFAGRLEDRRYDTPTRELLARDTVLRLRVYRDGDRATAELGWKGATEYEGGYKVREELQTDAGDPLALAGILERLGYLVTRAIDRVIAQYVLLDKTIRVESETRMADL